MDPLSILIILIATLTAVAFKIVLIRKIRHWMDQDLIKGLAGNNGAKLAALQAEYARLQGLKTPRKALHQQLELFAKNYSGQS